jgi:sugar lactone lactonase YvrE
VRPLPGEGEWPRGPATTHPRGARAALVLALLGAGCGRSALSDRGGGGATGGRGAVAGLPGAGGSTGGTPSTGGETLRPEVGDAGRDQRVEAGGDMRRGEASSEAGLPDLRIDSGGWLGLFAGGLGGPGNVDGIGAAARFQAPRGVAVDRAGNLFVVDMYSSTIRKVVIATGEVTTLAGYPGQHGSSDGIGAAARFYYPSGVASDEAGNLFVADTDNNTIRKVVVATGEVTTLAGSPLLLGSSDGSGAAARFHLPSGIASDGAGNLFVADSYNHAIRKVVIATGAVTTVAGAPDSTGGQDGVGAAARFYYPSDVAADGNGNLFVADDHGQTIRKLVIATGAVTTLAGSPGQSGSRDGTGAAARFASLHGLASDGAGSLFVADSENQTIRRVAIATGQVSTLAGSPAAADSSDGSGALARFRYPFGVASDRAGRLFVADSDNVAIRQVMVATAEVTTLAGSPAHVGERDGTGSAARFDTPTGVASDGAGSLWVADSANHTLRRVVLATGEVTTLAGLPRNAGSADGRGTAARFHSPNGVASDGVGNLFVADSDNRTIRKVVVATGEVSTVAGAAGVEGSSDGRGVSARFARPLALASDGAGNLFITDAASHTIRKMIMTTGEVTTLAGSPGRWGSRDGFGAAAEFDLPYGIASDGAGHLFVADFGNYTIRKVVLATSEVTTLAGAAGQEGSRDGPGTSARFSPPTGVACDGAGQLFVADTDNHTVRQIAIATGIVTTVIGSSVRAGVLLGSLPAGLGAPFGLAPGPAGELYLSDQEESAILVAQLR